MTTKSSKKDEKKSDVVSHRAYNLYLKAKEAGTSQLDPLDSNYFNDLVKHVANQINLSLVETKEAIYQGYSNLHNFSYEEGKEDFKKSLNPEQ